MRTGPLFAMLWLAPLPALAASDLDFNGQLIESCAAELTAASRLSVLDACGQLIQMGELPPAIIAPAHIERGRAYQMGGETARALADFENAILVDARNPFPYAARGMILLQQGRYQDAWNDYDGGLAQNGSDAEMLYGRALAAAKLGQDGTADRAKALGLDPGIAQYFAQRGLTP